MADEGRLRFPDGLRGVAALAVVLPHSLGLYIFEHANAFSRAMARVGDEGRYGVEVFFVVSGFVIAHTLRSASVRWRDMGAFLVRRSVRLDPPYWASIVLMIGYLALHATLSSKLTEWPTLPQLAAHVFYMQELLGYRELNVVYWTLCIEFQFYISFAIFVASAAAVARSRGEAPSRSVAAAGTVLFLVSTLWPAGIVSWLATPEFLFPHLHAFFAGAVTAWAMGGALPNRHWLACALALAVAVVVHPNVPSSVVLGTMVALHVAARRGAMATWLSARPLQYLGRISYSLYLVHVPISVTLLGIRVRLAPESNVAAVIFQLLVFALSIAAAHLLHVSIEAPCIRVSKKLKEQWSVGASTVAVPAAPAEAAFEAPT